MNVVSKGIGPVAPPWSSINEIRSFLTTEVLTGNYRMPSSKALESLSFKLGAQQYLFQKDFETYQKTAHIFNDSKFEKLANDLKFAVNDRETSLSANTTIRLFQQTFDQHMETCRQILPLLERLVQQNEALGSAFKAYNSNWHAICWMIARSFIEAMQSTNAKSLGLSNEGPVARFTSKVIPWITGECPLVSAVAQELKRRERDNRDAAMRFDVPGQDQLA